MIIKLLGSMSIFFLLIGSALGAERVKKSRKFFREYSFNNTDKSKYDYSDIAIIIPVYNEQNVIKQSVLNFMKIIKNKINVYYVTTDKENSKVTTKNLLDEIIRTEGIEDYCHIINCPYTFGVMAHQLNYAINSFNDNKIFFIYNVDSVIDLRTINYVLKNKDKLKEYVFQQYSYSDYTENNFIMDSGISWQNRWSLAYELPKAIYSIDSIKLVNFNYVIGHGLVFTKEMYGKFGTFSEEDINEDNVLGYILSLKKILICPIPYLEKINFAENTQIYIKQQSAWFNGPLYAFSYYRHLLKKKECCSSKMRMFLTASLNFKSAINWNVFPIICIISIVGSYLKGLYPYFFGICTALVLYVSLINDLSYRLLKEITLNSSNKKRKLSIIVDCFFWLFIHTAGPMKTLVKILLKKNNQENKYKTEKS